MGFFDQNTNIIKFANLLKKTKNFNVIFEWSSGHFLKFSYFYF
jgi:hypothetical protein